MLFLSSFAVLTPLLAPQGYPDWTIPPGVTTTFNAGGGVVDLSSLTIGAGGTLRFVGDSAVHLRVHGPVRVDGTLDVSGAGFSTGIGVVTFNTTQLQEAGRDGGPGGASGGTGNRLNFASSAIGGSGSTVISGAGQGGESGFANLVGPMRRPGGGGGGAFGPALQLLHPDPFDASNRGRVAQSGLGGSTTALGAITQLLAPAGGNAGSYAFVDANAANDFWGRRVDPSTLQIVVGELAAPRGGAGGGAGGNSIQSAVFPASWSPTGDEKGSGGAGGGGLLIVRCQLLTVGAQGRILADGGRGGTGENTSGLNCIGGGSGGGSGGMVVLQPRRIDLSAAANSCLTALGGDGGRGADNLASGVGAGGDGGPGLIQLHLSNGLADVVLSGGRTLADMSAPEALVLMPESGL